MQQKHHPPLTQGTDKSWPKVLTHLALHLCKENSSAPSTAQSSAYSTLTKQQQTNSESNSRRFMRVIKQSLSPPDSKIKDQSNPLHLLSSSAHVVPQPKSTQPRGLELHSVSSHRTTKGDLIKNYSWKALKWGWSSSMPGAAETLAHQSWWMQDQWGILVLDKSLNQTVLRVSLVLNW